jgi:hypothetical protein
METEKQKGEGRQQKQKGDSRRQKGDSRSRRENATVVLSCHIPLTPFGWQEETLKDIRGYLL